MTSFQREHKIRFAECDYAGIMYYPRYFDGVNATVEDWFDEGLGVSFKTLIGERRLGAPLVGIETKFIRPCRLGDLVTFDLSVTKLGTSSVTLDMKTLMDGDMRMRSRMTIVSVDFDMNGSAPWPDDIREKMLTYQKTARKVEDQ